MENKLSLWDYLGYPAGEKLGKLVAEYAKLRKYTGSEYRAVQTKRYQGYVTTYSKEFLDECFAVLALTSKYVVESVAEAEEKFKQELLELNSLLDEDLFEVPYFFFTQQPQSDPRF